MVRCIFIYGRDESSMRSSESGSATRGEGMDDLVRKLHFDVSDDCLREIEASIEETWSFLIRDQPRMWRPGRTIYHLIDLQPTASQCVSPALHIKRICIGLGALYVKASEIQVCRSKVKGGAWESLALEENESEES